MKFLDYIVLFIKVIAIVLCLIFLVKGIHYVLVDIMKFAIPEKIFSYLHVLAIVPAYSYGMTAGKKIKEKSCN